VLLCDVRFERIARRTELLTEGADETLRAEVLGLYMIADCAGIAGGVVTVRTTVHPSAQSYHLALNSFHQFYNK
jgi:hypothetical protein